MEVEVYWEEWCPLNESSYQAARTLYVAACIHEMLDEKERHALIIAEIEDSDIIVEGDGETEDLFDFQVLKITEECPAESVSSNAPSVYAPAICTPGRRF